MSTELELVPYQHITLGHPGMASTTIPSQWIPPAELAADVKGFQKATVQLLIETLVPEVVDLGELQFTLQSSNDKQAFQDITEASELFSFDPDNVQVTVDRIYMLTQFARYLRATFTSTSFEGTFAVRIVVHLNT